LSVATVENKKVKKPKKYIEKVLKRGAKSFGHKK